MPIVDVTRELCRKLQAMRNLLCYKNPRQLECWKFWVSFPFFEFLMLLAFAIEWLVCLIIPMNPIKENFFSLEKAEREGQRQPLCP